MEIQEALQTVRKLGDGIHPETGEVLQTDCLYQQPKPHRIPDKLLLLLLTISLCVSCGGLQGNGGGGGSGNPGTPPGTYNLSITATSGSITHGTQVTLTVTP